MMYFEIIFVLLTLAGMVTALIYDAMRPGMVLFSVVVVFMVAGILSPAEVLEGFSNKGMITVAMLFLVSEGIRQSGVLAQVIKNVLPKKKATVAGVHLRLLPTIAAMSAFLNNTPVVVIFAPIIRNWAVKMKMAPTKFLIPLSYATILGGMCTLIGTSTNLVVYGMVTDAGYRGFSMFELGKVGVFIAIAGMLYIILFSKRLLPDFRADRAEEELREKQVHIVEVVLGARFPGIRKTIKEFDFQRHYGAKIVEVRRGGESLTEELGKIRLREGDTLVLRADETFIPTWGDSRVFLMVSNGKEEPAPDDAEIPRSRRRKLFAMVLLVLMILGATLGELPFMKNAFPNVKLDMFFFVAITTVIMAVTKLFPPKNYTKYISWDILITIACAFAISKAMENSGFASVTAGYIISLSERLGPHALLAIIFIITNLFTELITNNAAAALAFPIALSVATQLNVSPMPFFVTICMAASTSFSSPIGYQTNLIVQGIGNYKFTDFVKVGLPLNIISFLLSVFLIPVFWKF